MRFRMLVMAVVLILPLKVFAQSYRAVPVAPSIEPAPAQVSTNQLQLEAQKRQILELASRRRSPFVGSMFSLMVAGTGQFYNGQYSKGSLFFLGETVYYGFMYGMKLKCQNTYGDTLSFKALNPADKVLLISSFVIYLGFKGYCMYDAYTSAVDINRKIGETLEHFTLSVDTSQVSLYCSLRF